MSRKWSSIGRQLCWLTTGAFLRIDLGGLGRRFKVVGRAEAANTYLECVNVSVEV